MQIVSAAQSNMGNIRKNNEDNLYYNGFYLDETNRDMPFLKECNCSDKLQIYAVCDGMGGEEFGEVSSFFAVSTLGEHHKATLEKAKSAADLKEYFKAANKKIAEFSKDNGKISGTTFAGVVVYNRHVRVFNIGDSRVYRYRKGKLKLLSEDDTPAFREYKLGIISKEDIANHPYKNMLTQYLGMPEDDAPVVHCKKAFLHPKDRFLICSDGVTDMISEDMICNILNENKTPPAAVRALTNSALYAGGKDNITAIVLDSGNFFSFWK